MKKIVESRGESLFDKLRRGHEEQKLTDRQREAIVKGKAIRMKRGETMSEDSERKKVEKIGGEMMAAKSEKEFEKKFKQLATAQGGGRFDKKRNKRDFPNHIFLEVIPDFDDDDEAELLATINNTPYKVFPVSFFETGEKSSKWYLQFPKLRKVVGEKGVKVK